MEKFNVIKDIAERTGGDIYLGIVGPVRTGKSTFIKKFMEELVIPEIDDKYAQERALDELPQSGGGKTVMTTEPKFIPSEAVEINVCDGVSAKLRMIDCVGYCIDGALGFEEDESPRMVHTPWFEEAIPFTEAAEIGTKKVICEHSTIGIMISTDGTVTDIERSSYVEAEQRVVAEMKELGKPFLMILNSLNPHADSVISLAEELQTEYGITVLPMNIARMTINDMQSV
ncbi:MAG: stage IV sporulation protein A, partial [Firmicutes bacterium]|nr:stage IV sporulation protein A [Bacillota bacterium]